VRCRPAFRGAIGLSIQRDSELLQPCVAQRGGPRPPSRRSICRMSWLPHRPMRPECPLRARSTASVGREPRHALQVGGDRQVYVAAASPHDQAFQQRQSHRQGPRSIRLPAMYVNRQTAKKVLRKLRSSQPTSRPGRSAAQSWRRALYVRHDLPMHRSQAHHS